jgi:thiol-disulfide isomerase/thioredoxin
MVASLGRVRAPRLAGAGGWINTDHPLSLRELRGRIVLLDFWTFACVNCLHVADELRPLEAKYADVLTLIGVHSPKFAHEADHGALISAVERYEIHHPILDDPQLAMWQQYAVKAWPTLVVIDPEGYVVAHAAGEGQVSALDAVIAELVTEHHAKGTLRRGTPHRADQPVESTLLRFPAKAVLLPAARSGRSADSLLIADAGSHRILETDLCARTLLRSIGSGRRGRDDGAAPSFADPGALALLPPEVAGVVGYDVVVADTANHLLRGLRLADGQVHTISDLGDTGLSTITGPVPGVASPWDVLWWPALERIVVAAAGVHLLLTFDPISKSITLLAGTTVEGLRDGPGVDGWLAQPSGLAADSDRLWFVDAETSALRWIEPDASLHTAIGEGLFDYGYVDGPAELARLQHPLGVTVLSDGSVAISDTFNGAIRRYDPVTQRVETIADGLSEPGGAVLLGDDLLVVESSAHRITPIGIGRAVDVTGDPIRTERPGLDIGSGPVRLTVRFTPAPGRAVDERFGPATRLSVSASSPELLCDGAGESTVLNRVLVFGAPGTSGVLQVSAQAASCDHEPAVPNPACYVSRQDWGVPVRVVESGATEVELVLLG